MASYVRQSTFADGDLITAALFNNEYNQLVSAFDNATGHKHDGTVGEGPVISVLGDAGLATPLNKILIDTTNDHIEFWVDVSGTSTQQLYIADGAIVPTTNDDVDLGTGALKFKDLYLSGTANITGNAVVTGNLTVEGTTVTLNTATLDVEDKNITLNYGAGDTSSNANGAGITIQDAVDASTDATILWNAANDRFDFSHAIDVTGSATVDGLTVDGTATIKRSGTGTAATIGSQGSTNNPVVLVSTNESANSVSLGVSASVSYPTFYLQNSQKNYLSIGTGGDISFYEDTGTTAKLFWDASAESLGIGTSSPQGNLHVEGAAGVSGGGIIYVTDADNGSTASDALQISKSGDTAFIYNRETLGNLQIGAGGNANHMIVRTDGKVGIGTTSPSTTLDVNGTIKYGSLSDGTITITGFVDEDNMATNSATLVPTQQSVKAYVDSQISSAGGNGISFEDNEKAQFGDGNDLQIFHDGSHSYIDEVGTGSLYIRANDFRLANADGSQNHIIANNNGAVSLRYSGSPKLATTSTGIDVTGTVTSDGLTVDASSGYGSIEIGGTSGAYLDLKAPSSDDYDLRLITTGTSGELIFPTGNFVFKRGSLQKLAVTDTGIDVTGTVTSDGLTVDSTTGFSWLPVSTAGIELGTIGTGTGIIINTPSVNSSYGSGLAIDGSYASDLSSVNIKAFGAKYNSYGSELNLFTSDDTSLLKRLAIASTGDISFYDDTGTTQGLFWDASAESLGIGTTSPNETLSVRGNIGLLAYDSINWRLGESSTVRASISTVRSGNAHRITFGTSATTGTATEKMRLDEFGNLGIGTDSPSAKLHIDSTGDALQFTRTGQETYKVTHGTSGLYTLLGSTIAIGVTQNHDFGVYDNTGSLYAMFDGSTSRVGIGTSSPDSPLHISGTNTIAAEFEQTSASGEVRVLLEAGGTSSQLQFAGASHASRPNTLSISSANHTKFVQAGQTVMYLDSGSGGRVGIGTTSPSFKLHVDADGSGVIAGFFNSTDTTSEEALLQVGGTLTDNYGVMFGAKPEVDTPAVQDHAFIVKTNDSTGTDHVERFRISSDGNVGIGTDAPSSVLEIADSGVELKITDTRNITWTAGDTVASLGFYSDDASGSSGAANNLPRGAIDLVTTSIYGSTHDMVFRTRGDTSTTALEKLRITSTGNVGIGTDSPSAALNIVRSGLSTQFRVSNTESDATIKYGAIVGSHYTNAEEPIAGMLMTSSSSVTGGSVSIGGGISAANAVNNILFYTAANNTTLTGSEAGRFDSSGNLLVGRPSTLNNAQTSIKGASGKQVLTLQTTTDGNSFIQGYNSSTALAFQVRGDGDVYISGDLGIGTTSPVTPLHVSTAKSSVTDSVLTLQDTTETFGRMIEFVGQGSTDSRGIIGFQEPQANAPELFIANGGGDALETGVGLAFWSYINVDRISPCDNLGDYKDDEIDLGWSNARFDDIYATNGTIQTSDRNDKQDIQALTDAETRVATTCKGLIRKFRWKSAVAEKDDNSDSDETARIHFGIIAQDLQDAFTAEGLDAGNYAMFTSQTWEDSDGVEQTRLGVRYSELLAFIIAAI
jgi:hypothetical protein